jgi:hypothetical protein
MKDVTSTSFGLVIAFLLPGLAALYALTFWSPRADKVLQQFLTSKSDLGLFFLVLLTALACGLQVTVIRWFVFEKILCSKHRIQAKSFASLKSEETLLAFRAAVDEHYRYHQFWGGFAIVIPFAIGGLLYSFSGTFESWMWIIVALGVEIQTTIAACDAFQKYTVRAQSILNEPRKEKTNG